MLESDILHKAIEQLEQRMQVQIEVETTSSVNGHRWDAEIDIQTGAVKNHFKVEVKGSVLPANLARWAEKLQVADALLVAKYISNPAKALLEQQGIN